MPGKTPQKPSNNAPDFSAGAKMLKVTDDPATTNQLEPAKPKTEKKEKRRPLKGRDYKFVEAKSKNPDMPDYKAAMIATGTTDPKVASVQAVRMLENVSLREALQDALVNQGFSIDDGAKALVDALQAKKTTQGVEYEKLEDGTSTTRPTLVETDVPDHGIRINAARTIFSFLGDKKEDGGGGAGVVNFNIGNVFVKKGDA